MNGKGIAGSRIVLYASGTSHAVTSVTTDDRGKWSKTIFTPSHVPCVLQADSGGIKVDKAVSGAPVDCLAADNTADNSDSTTTDPVPQNNPPELSGTPNTRVAEGVLYHFTPTANDPDGDNLNFSILNRPSWASFSTSNGTLSGTPGSSDAGSYENIRISVSDGSASATLGAFSITVSNTNQAPVISGSPATGTEEGSSYRFTPTASDPDGDNLSFSILNRPSWASFSTSNGTLSGTPGTSDAGSYENIRISVSDGSASATLGAFSITVSNINQAPIISGSPSASVEEGSSYSFSPTASDPDGDPLNFSITNLPVWAGFDSAAGTLSGTPGSADVGTYDNIVITASDGSASALLGPISISVTRSNATATGSVNISWVAPAARADGSPLALSEISSYKVYMGTSSDNLDVTDTIDDSSMTEYTADNLSAGTYYFAISTNDTDGRESALSDIVEKMVSDSAQ